MPRIACLWIPDWCLQSHLRLDPSLAAIPLALVDARGDQSLVVAVSAPAAHAGVAVGMRVAEARAVSSYVVTRPVSSEAVASAVTVLADVAGTMSSRVEIGEHGRVFASCEGSGLLWASESEIASMLAARAARCGLQVRIGIADSKLTAFAAAREGGGVRIVLPGQAKTYLAPFPLRILDPDPESAVILANWGIRLIGELAALPTGALAHRLGLAGASLARRARGEDDAPLVGQPVPRTFEESLALDSGVESLEPLIFVLRRLIECVTTRIELYGFACQALEIGFDLEGGGRDLRTVKAAAPTVEPKILLTVLRAQLERSPLQQAVVAVVVKGLPTRMRPTQLDLLRPSGPAPVALASTIARLAILCGPDQVGVLREGDTHRPDVVAVGEFEGMATAYLDVDGQTHRAKAGLVIRLAVRVFRPPVPLEVFESKGQLDYVRGRGFDGRVVQWAGPWRLRGEWWTATPYAREYYDVELSDGGVYRVYRDVRLQCWLADGMYD